MDGIAIFFTSLAALSVAWFIVSTLLIYDNLRRRGEKVNFILVRGLAPSYASRYRKITREETGSPGRLFYHWLISINAALVFVILAMVFNNF